MQPRIFVIEDDDAIRRHLIEALSDLGHAKVVDAVAGEAAAAAWLDANPDAWDLVVVDLFIDRGNGLTLLATHRRRAPTQKMVVLTNFATRETRRQCAELGADAVFDKSTELPALIDYCIGLGEPAAGQLR